MGKNLSERLRKNEDIDSVHELFEYFFIGGFILEIKERIAEEYNNGMNEIGKIYGRFRRYI